MTAKGNVNGDSEFGVFTTNGMGALLTLVALTFTGFSLLLSISPSWVIAGGASEFAAGSVTAVLMLFTILAQLGVSSAIRRFGWTVTLTVGIVLLSVPAPFQAIAPTIELVLVSSALRGVGFGIMTVCGATAVSLLTPVSQRGKAVGAYGLASSVPQLIFASSAPILADVLGDQVVLISAVLPLAGLVLVARLGGRLSIFDRTHEERSGSRPKTLRYVFSTTWPSLLALVIVTSTGGAVLTFANQIAPSSSAATTVLFLLTGSAVVARWLAGTMSDKLGTRTMIPALVVITAFAALFLSGSLALSGTLAGLLFLIIGAVSLGIAYGGLQSATLIRAFQDGGASNASRVSVLWNLSFDLGMGAGAMVVGAIAQSKSFALAFGFMAGFAAVTAVLTKDQRRISVEVP
ncbi:MFS transporter [Pararhizobium sp. YC-54]|uniref:MFS transporter n=1 Tax=Pararhizobium sp. YC-54 TaxID=2986920 RepID=UPI0021F6BEAE|nr:MFS transporter [Pararhizobium sp. YC-54]MCV9999355.1 MFS transporter [Pararhizobium sp. YC-54]